jgi:hypothetical protein
MANALYASALEGFLDGTINWSTGTIKCVIVNASYTPVLGTDKFLSSISPANRLATSLALTSKTVTNGVADAADLTITPGPANLTVLRYLVIYQDSGLDTTSRLIACFDTAGGTGLGVSVISDGNDVDIIWDSGTNKIFHL